MNIEIEGNSVIITFDEEEVAEINEYRGQKTNDYIWCEMFYAGTHSFGNNSDWDYWGENSDMHVYVGALTGSPLITKGADINDGGDIVNVDEVAWFPSYEGHNEFDQLPRIVFDIAGDVKCKWKGDKMKELFVSEKHYLRYLYAKDKAIKINKYLGDKNYIVLKKYSDGYIVEDGMFIFENDDAPVIMLKKDGNGTCYLGWEWKNNHLIYIESKKKIDQLFNSFIIFNLHDKIKYAHSE